MNQMNNPLVIRETISGINTVSLESVLFENRSIVLTGEIDREISMEICKELLVLDKQEPGVPITIYINSPGGSVTDGLAIYDTICLLQSPVNTICMGLAASMGATLFLAGKERLMLPHSKIMIHDASYGNADFAGLKPNEIQKRTDDLMETCKVLRGIIAERTGQNIRVVERKMREDSFFSLEEALEFGLATGKVTSL